MSDGVMSAAEYLDVMGVTEHATAEMSAEEYLAFLRGGVPEKKNPQNIPAPQTGSPGKVKHEKPKAQLRLESWLERMTNARGLPMVREFRGVPGRQFRFDYAMPGIRVAIEYDALNPPKPNADGSGSLKAAHASAAAVMNDSVKINLAQIAGWMVIRVNARSLGDGTGYEMIAAAFAARKAPLPGDWGVGL